MTLLARIRLVILCHAAARLVVVCPGDRPEARPRRRAQSDRKRHQRARRCSSKSRASKGGSIFPTPRPAC